jgi:hypothetical protein
MKIILTNTQLKQLNNKLNSENLHEALQFQKRICDATFNCFIQEKNEQKKYLKQLIEENFISLGYSKKKLIEYRTRVSEKLLIENTEDIKTITNTHFLNLEKFIKEQEETQPQVEEPKEQIDTTTNPQYDFKLYFEDGKKKYAWKLKNTEQWYDAEGELSKEIEKRIPFNSAPSVTQQTLSDEQVAEKIKKTGFDKFFAGLRRALNSPMGALLQRFLSLTGIGAIATTVAWGALTLYDAYMAISGKGSWMLLLIDIFSLISNGYLTKFLQPLQNVMSSGITQAIESIKKFPKIYDVVKKFLPKMIEKFANVNKLISQGDTWAKKKLKADMAKGKDAIQQVQTEIETLNQTEPQGTTSTGQTTNENYLYVQKKLINYKSIYNKKVYEKFI